MDWEHVKDDILVIVLHQVFLVAAKCWSTEDWQELELEKSSGFDEKENSWNQI